jgi:hypothetical protein
LRGDRRAKHLQSVGHNGRRRFVAGGLEREDIHHKKTVAKSGHGWIVPEFPAQID